MFFTWEVYCQQCKRLCESGTAMGCTPRVQRVYCSAACRQKAYRIRNGQKYDRPGRPRKTGKS